jgi:hypothetical protein
VSDKPDEDWDPVDYEKYRCQWIADGMRWWDDSRRPPRNWDPAKQLRDAELSCPDIPQTVAEES